MSVILLDHEIYQDCEKTLASCGFFANGHENSLYWNIDAVYYDNKPQTELQSFFINLCKANFISYVQRYEPTLADRPANRAKDYSCFLSFSKGRKLTDCQLLKYLQCIRYQIEGKAEKVQTIKTLDTLIKLVSNKIIQKLPEYKNANWSKVA